jgi:hypothetical protein
VGSGSRSAFSLIEKSPAMFLQIDDTIFFQLLALWRRTAEMCR